jgi:hypothetical protein
LTFNKRGGYLKHANAFHKDLIEKLWIKCDECDLVRHLRERGRKRERERERERERKKERERERQERGRER